MKQLLESGVHFGHQTRRWNPKMKPYIFTERGGIHIIDLQQTTVMLDRAYDFVRNVTGRGGSILFVGTKKQCQDVIREEASRVGMPYVSHRWLGGLLTNFATIENRIRRMHELRKLKEEGQLALLPTKERMAMERELEKLEINLGGVSNMSRLPDAVFVADPKREAIATKEVNKLGLPLIGLVDTNCDPDEVDYLIPGNDDAIRSCSLIIKTLARAVEEGRQKVQLAEFQAAQEAREAAEAAVASGAQSYAPEASAAPAPSRVSRSSRGGDGRSDRQGGRGGQGRPRPRDGAPGRGGYDRRSSAPRPAPARQARSAAPSEVNEAPAEETPVSAAADQASAITPSTASTAAPVSETPATPAPEVENASVEAPAVEAETNEVPAAEVVAPAAEAAAPVGDEPAEA
ncbi:MAG: 30S ribosomal protein S2 [Thermoleophilia bacterium]